MANRSTPAQKQEALRLLAIHNNNVPIVHSLTGIPLSTLYYWRSRQASNKDASIGQKNIPSPIESVQQTESPPNPHHPGVELIQDGDLQYYRLPNGQVVSELPTGKPTPSSLNAGDDLASYGSPEQLPDPDSEDAQWQEDDHLAHRNGVPGRSYPYRLEEEEAESENQYEEFRKVREILMKHAHRLAINLKPDEPDINRRSLALSRILDSIKQLDDRLPDLNPEKVIRFEYGYDGLVHDVPPWKDPE